MITLRGYWLGHYGRAWMRQLVDPGALGRVALLWLAVTVVLGSAGLWLYGDLPALAESLLVILVALCALAYGLRGGVVAASVALALHTTAHLVDHGAAGVDHAAHSVTLVLVGCLTGWFVDQRRALADALARHEQLSLDLVAEANFDGFFTRINPAWTRLLGYRPDELLGRPFFDFVHPDDRAATVASVAQQTEAGQEVRHFENRYRHQDGSYRWLEWASRPDEGRRRLIAVARDITERKHAEEQEKLRSRELVVALEGSRETSVRLNLVAEAVLEGLVTIDVKGTILNFNRSAERLFGYRREEAIGMNADVLTAGHGQEGYVARYTRTGEEGIIGARHETLGRRKDGSVFPIELAIGETIVRNETIFIGVVRDITERKRHDDAEAHYKGILEHTVSERTRELQQRTEELDDARLETLRRLALAAEYRDDQTFEHAQRVGNTAALLGELLGLTAREVDTIRQAAPLHDIGKLSVSDTILLKPGLLTPEEWEQVRSHARVGHDLLAGSTSDVLSLGAEIALAHHEWWDGSGYPQGLRGRAIPLSARIVGLADVFDSLCHERSYKPAWTVEDAVAEIHRLDGDQFDPAVVRSFNQLDPHQLAEGCLTGLPAQSIQKPSGNVETPAAGLAPSGLPVEEPTENVASVAKHAGAKENGASPDMGDGRFRRLVERSNDLIFQLDLEGIVMSANPAVERLTGFRSEETVGTNFLEYLAPADLERAGALFTRVMAGADVVSEELELVAKGGHSVFLDVSARPIAEGRQLVGVEGIARDVSERRALLDALTFQSLHDPLTGLPNRVLFGGRLAHAFARSQRDSSTVAVMLFDLDDFKLINDSLGHGVGDEVLVAVASRLDRELRKSDRVMRLGGDEFAVIVDDAKSETDLVALAARILAAVTGPLAIDDPFGQITASLGIAQAEPDDDPASLLRKADIAMYQAKAEHPGSFRFYHPNTPEFPQPRNARPSPVPSR